MHSEHAALIALNMVPDIGSVTVRKLTETFGSAAKALGASAHDLLACPGIGRARAEAFADAFRRVDPGAEEARAAKLHVRLVAQCDAEYPQALREIHDPPLVLYCAGDLSAFDAPGVAMVGTRTPTVYGRETARRFAYGLAAAGYAVVSGMARGIDAAAHRGALDAHGRTIGVLGGAIDCFYPEENRELARETVKSGGLVVSEYPFGRKPDRQTFPMRNRIISGLSAGTLVVEAAVKSGSLITAEQATEQGRAVMAIPGRIDTPTSLGCNKLIRDGAKIVLSPDDVIDELSAFPFAWRQANAQSASRNGATPTAKAPAPADKSTRPFVPLSDEEQRLVDAIGPEETQVDEVIRVSGVEAGRASALLITLQLKRQLKLLPGGWVTRNL